MMIPSKALSLRQPWCDAVVNGDKRIENRVKWKNSHFRGEVLLHAAKGMTRAEYKDAIAFLIERRITREQWQPPPPDELERGGIVGVARVVGVTTPVQLPLFAKRPTDGWRVHIGDSDIRPAARPDHVRAFTEDEAQWWMGGFALVLDDVRPLPFTPCVGALGFFTVSKEVMTKLEAAVAQEEKRAIERNA